MNLPAAAPERIVLTGFMGAGKSTIGPRLARALGWEFVDLDQEIVRAEQKSIAAIFQAAGETEFRRLEHLALTRALERGHLVVAMGGGAIETEANRLRLGAGGTLLVYLQAPLHILTARCGEQQQADPEAARRPVLEKQAELAERFLRRKPFYESAHWTVPTAECGPEEIAQIILDRWKRTYGAPL